MYELSERQKLVLALVIRDYIETAQPVGSRRLVENYQLNSKTQKEERHLLIDTIVQEKPTKLHQDIGVAVYLATQKR